MHPHGHPAGPPGTLAQDRSIHVGDAEDAAAASLKPRPWRFPIWLAAVAALVCMWLTMFILWPIGAVLGALLIVFLFRRRRRLAIVCLLLSPYLVLSALSVLGGIVGYSLGTAHLRLFGMPHREFYNLDERWRVYRSTSGCIVDGSEIFTHEPNNAVIKLLVTVLGPMRGAYAGPYPSKAEVAAQLSGATAVPRQSLSAGAVVVAGQSVKLEAETVTELGRRIPAGELSGVFFGANQELLLLTSAMAGGPKDQAPRPEGSADNNEDAEAVRRARESGRSVALIDRQRGRLFATYYDIDQVKTAAH